MIKRLFIIGNGFDLEHKLPTSFDKDFKKIAESNECKSNFWDLYQTENPNIWSDFEYCLRHPDFNSLEEIFVGYAPNYMSDHESDRDAIIMQADISGNLYKSLNEFAEIAEADICKKYPLKKYINYFNDKDIFVSFNYTHTLEILYEINYNNVLHIHGEVGMNNLILGYLKGKYEPEKYGCDSTQKGRVCIYLDINDYVKQIEDFYIRSAYEALILKTESFYKEFQKKSLSSFLDGKTIDEIIILGHSCKIDFEYFQYIWYYNLIIEMKVF